jgi:hypothetical protein
MTLVGYLNGIPASNGYRWISGTNSLSNNLYYANASNPVLVNPWTVVTPTIFTTTGYCVCYGGTIWVAGGLGTNTLAYSYDGNTWVGLGTTVFPNGCTSICWNGTRFIGAGGNYVGYSKDGITWYSSTSIITTLNSVVSNPGIGAFVPPSAMVLNNNGLTGNGFTRSQTLEIVSSDPYFQTGFDNVSIQLNAKYNQQSGLSNIYAYQNNALMYGCYSVRLVVPSYTGPVINVTRSSDKTTTDFYTDATQSYLTAGPNNTGTTFATWSSGSDISLNIWYDQSGKANHCTQKTQAFQPKVVLCSNIYVVWFNNPVITGGGCYVKTTNPILPYSILTQFNDISLNNSVNPYNSIACNSTGAQSNITNYGIRMNTVWNGAGSNDWIYPQSGTRYAYVNGASATSITLGISFNTLAYSISVPGYYSVNPSNSSINVIGTDGYDQKTRGMNGYMTEFIMYNSPLQPTDLVNYNTNIINPSVFQLPSYMYCCYSTRLFVPTYTGPVFNATRSTDLNNLDFYSDVTQSYVTNGANNTGVSFATWSAGATVYGNIWYDQSGKANHLKQTNPNNQPIISYYGNKILFYFNSTGANPQYGNITTPMNPYTVLTTFNDISLNSYNTIATSSLTDFNIKFTNNSTYGDSSGNDWYYSGSTPKFSYVNGSSTTTINLSSTFTSLALSVNTVSSGNVLTNVGYSFNNPANNSLNGYMTEFVAYNTPLLSSDLINYNTFSFKPSIFQLTSIMLGCYSVRLFVPGYSGPVMNVSRSYDLSSTDFYTDSGQSYLTTGPNNTGTTFSAWDVSSSIIYLNTWYDQSGKGNHGTTSATIAQKPTVASYNGQYLVYFNSTTNPQGVSFNTPIAPITILTEFNNITTNTYNTIASAYPTDFGIRIVGSNTVNATGQDWYYTQGAKSSYVNGQSTNNIYLSRNFNSLGLCVTTASGTPFTNIGIDGNNITSGRSFNGYMSDFVAYNTALPTSELVNYNNYKLM